MSIEKIIKFCRQRSHLILWAAIFVYIVLFSALSLKKYYLFAYNAFDLAIFNQVFYNTINGDFFAGTVNINIYLADHFTPIIFLLLPLYYFWQSAETLLILQAAFLGLSAWPLYKISLKISKDKLISLVAAFMWLFNPYLHSANLFEFHLVSIAVFFLFWAFYFYKKNNFKIFLVFFILTMLVREDMSLLLLGFPIITFLDKKNIKWKITTILLPLAYFLSAMKIISHYSEIGNTKFIIYYSWLGGSDFLSVIWAWISHPFQFLSHIVSPMNIGGLFVILLPVLFLPLINKKYLWLLFFPLTQFLLTSSGINFVIYLTHYILFLLPAIFIAIIYSFRDLKQQKKFWGSKIIYGNKNFCYALLFFAIIYFSVTLSPVRGMMFYDYDKLRIEQKKEFASLIESDDKIAAQSGLIPNLSSRRIIYPIGYAYFGSGQFAYNDFDLPKLDKILIDFDDFMAIMVERETGPLLQDDKLDMPAHFRSVLANYNLTKAENNYFLWEYKEKSNKNLLIYEIDAKPIGFEKEDFLVDYSKAINDNQEFLKLTFQKNELKTRDYIVRFYRGEYYYDIPLDYGLLPEYEWQPDELYSFYYYPDKIVDGFEIFSWQGENKLGHIREIVPDLELESVASRIDL